MTKNDVKLMAHICSRYERLAASLEIKIGARIDRMIDLEKAHEQHPLDLSALLDADDENFVHDVAGIHRHMDRTTGELTDCFLPRFAIVAA